MAFLVDSVLLMIWNIIFAILDIIRIIIALCKRKPLQKKQLADKENAKLEAVDDTSRMNLSNNTMIAVDKDNSAIYDGETTTNPGSPAKTKYERLASHSRNESLLTLDMPSAQKEEKAKYSFLNLDHYDNPTPEGPEEPSSAELASSRGFMMQNTLRSELSESSQKAPAAKDCLEPIPKKSGSETPPDALSPKFGDFNSNKNGGVNLNAVALAFKKEVATSAPPNNNKGMNLDPTAFSKDCENLEDD
jgi:hypothetical protein